MTLMMRLIPLTGMLFLICLAQLGFLPVVSNLSAQTKDKPPVAETVEEPDVQAAEKPSDKPAVKESTEAASKQSEKPAAKQTGRPAAKSGARPAAKPAAKPAADEKKKPEVKPTLPETWADQAKWRSIGPANMGGRITAITVVEKSPSTWWAATASGGLVKTTNNGITFEHQFDDQATVSIGAVQVAPSNPEIVWVGTGENNPRNSVSWGDGVYKSVDGGKTWKNMGLQKIFQTGGIAIHPENPDVVWVGALGRLWGPNKERGLFKTVDGGKTWNNVLYIDENTGVVDVQLNPQNPLELLVATYERKRHGFDDNDPIQRFGAGGGIYKSVDGGSSFKKINDGLPTCKMGRIGLDYFHSDPKYVVAIIESEKIAKQPEASPFVGIRGEDADVGAKITSVTKDSPGAKAGLKADDILVSVDGMIVMSYEDLLGEIRKHQAGDKIAVVISRKREKIDLEIELDKLPGAMMKRETTPFTGTLGGQAANLQDQQGADGFEYGGIYLSEDGGDHWSRINSLNPRPMYYSHIRFDPNDRNNIYVCGTSLHRSSDGGKTFKGDGGSDGIHVDHHALWIDPSNPQHMILGNDGGIYVTYDRMEHWDHLNHIAIGQFYHVGIGTNRDYSVYGGMQDNGSWGGPSRGQSGEGPVNTDWIRVGGGDGFVTQVDPNDPSQIYYESQNGGMGRIHLETGDRGFLQPREQGQKFRFNWKTPFILSPHNSQIHYSAGNYVFRSLNKGSNAKRISPEITNSADGAGSAISESPVTEGQVYVGTTDGAVWMTNDHGANWQPLFYQPVAKEKAESKEGQAQAEETETDETKNVDPKPGETTGEKSPPDDSPPATKEMPPGKSEADPAEAAVTDLVSGTWDGLIEDDNLPGGRLEFTIELKKDEKNQLSGTIHSSQGDSKITGGQFDPDKQKLELDAENEEFAFEMDGDVTADQIVGVVSVNDGDMKMDFTAKKIKQAESLPAATESTPKEEASAESKSEATVAAPQKPETTEKDVPQQESETKKPAPSSEAAAPPSKQVPDNAVSGRWIGQLNSPRGEQEVTLVLKLVSNDNITGTFESTQGERDITSGSFDPETKKMTLFIESERFAMEFVGKVAEEKYSGDVNINSGAFTMTYALQRQSAAQIAAQEKQADATVPAIEYKQPTDEKSLSRLMPGPRWVSSIETSRFKKDRCYITFDGHRSDDDGVYVFVTNDGGKSWASLKNNLPDNVGSVHVVREDIKNENLLYLGCEFASWYSIDAGRSWTRIKGGLPTVAVHDFAIHPTAGEVVAATHGRSLWIGDVSVLRQVTEKSLAADYFLYQPQDAVLWQAKTSRGDSGTRRFIGTNPDRGTKIAYSLGKNASSVTLVIQDLHGEVVKTFTASNQKGLHVLNWSLDRDQSGGGRRFARALPAGEYLVVLKVDGERKDTVVSVVDEPLEK